MAVLIAASRPWAGVTDHLAVGIGTQLLGIVPGRVSTECDAHLSYDTQGTIDKVGTAFSPDVGLRSGATAYCAHTPTYTIWSRRCRRSRL